MLDHPFDPYTYGDQVFCIHVEGGKVCGRPEAEHAEVQAEPVSEPSDA